MLNNHSMCSGTITTPWSTSSPEWRSPPKWKSQTQTLYGLPRPTLQCLNLPYQTQGRNMLATLLVILPMPTVTLSGCLWLKVRLLMALWQYHLHLSAFRHGTYPSPEETVFYILCRNVKTHQTSQHGDLHPFQSFFNLVWHSEIMIGILVWYHIAFSENPWENWYKLWTMSRYWLWVVALYGALRLG